MIGWCNSYFYVNSAQAMSAGRVDVLFPSGEVLGGAVRAEALAAHLGVGEDQLAECIVGRVALRYALHWCAGLEKRRAEQLVHAFIVNGTITVTGGLPWAKWERLVTAVQQRH